MAIGTRRHHDRRIAPCLVLAGLLATQPALAHHMLDGETPTTLLEGLLSGLAHPLIGWDHALFLGAVGLLAAVAARAWTLPVVFVAAVPLGVAGHGLAGALPGTELLAPLTVLAIAGIMVLRPTLRTAPMAVLLALAGLAHGHAYAEAIIGAEPTPVAAYLAGLTVIQIGVAVGVALLARRLAALGALDPVRALRIAGAGILAAGTLLIGA